MTSGPETEKKDAGVTFEDLDEMEVFPQGKPSLSKVEYTSDHFKEFVEKKAATEAELVATFKIKMIVNESTVSHFNIFKSLGGKKAGLVFSAVESMHVIELLSNQQMPADLVEQRYSFFVDTSKGVAVMEVEYIKGKWYVEVRQMNSDGIELFSNPAGSVVVVPKKD